MSVLLTHNLSARVGVIRSRLMEVLWQAPATALRSSEHAMKVSVGVGMGIRTSPDAVCVGVGQRLEASWSWNLLVSDATGSSVLTTASISASMTSVTCGQFGRRGSSRATACSDSMSR